MKKTLIALLLISSFCEMMASDLPFKPTSDPNLPSTYWYFLKYDDIKDYYVVANADDQDTNFPESVSNSDAYSMWCFVGDEDSGYRVYNKGKGKYLSLGQFLNDDPDINPNQYVIVELHNEYDFYLRYDGFGVPHYLYMRTYVDQYGDLRYMDVAEWPMAPFIVELAIAGMAPPDDSSWTRQDADGVKYGFLDGGQSAVSTETSNNLIDNDATTKYYGTVENCWFIMNASADVAVKQYSIVTAGDTRQYYGRSLRSWKLQGSTDYVNWVDIDVRTDCAMPFADQQEVVFTVNDSRKFRFFKFIATQGVTDNVQLSEVWINGQNHSWGYATTDIEPTCGDPGQLTRVCDDCQAKRFEILPPTEQHNFYNDICSFCPLHENETLLLQNGQRVPYHAMAYHDYRTGPAGSEVWPAAPAGWMSGESFDSPQWHQVLMPIASPGHTGGPFSNLRYNSHWYGEYNCFYFVRTFDLPYYYPNATYTFNCVHDDNMVVYVNGSEVINEQGWTATPANCNWANSYDSYNVPATVFQQGKNVLSVYIQQNWGGAYFDCELIMKNNTVPGDVNGDKVVTAADITALYDFMLNNDSSHIVNGEQSGDGIITAADVTAVYSALLGNQ